MAFPDKKSMPMPPPSRKGGITMAIMSAKPKNSMPPPGMPPMDDAEGEQPEEKHSLESAGIIRADKHCKDCQNWSSDDGSCSELPSTFEPEDSCLAHFSPVGDEDEEESESEGQGMESEEPEDSSMVPQS